MQADPESMCEAVQQLASLELGVLSNRMLAGCQDAAGGSSMRQVCSGLQDCCASWPTRPGIWRPRGSFWTLACEQRHCYHCSISHAAAGPRPRQSMHDQSFSTNRLLVHTLKTPFYSHPHPPTHPCRLGRARTTAASSPHCWRASRPCSACRWSPVAPAGGHAQARPGTLRARSWGRWRLQSGSWHR